MLPVFSCILSVHWLFMVGIAGRFRHEMILPILLAHDYCAGFHIAKSFVRHSEIPKYFNEIQNKLQNCRNLHNSPLQFSETSKFK